MTIDERCHCGYITYAVEIDPAKPLRRLPDPIGLLAG
jgi:hypothetical protein